jgi:hypothetical protein
VAFGLACAPFEQLFLLTASTPSTRKQDSPWGRGTRPVSISPEHKGKRHRSNSDVNTGKTTKTGPMPF